MNTNYHKLKYFCQICSRQCQDKDGFTCHLKSKTHEKNMEELAMHPDLYIDAYSQEFEKGYLDIIKRLYQNQWVSANKIYAEYMNDKESIPLNMTKWDSLNKLILHLTTTNKCKINPSDNDIYLQYIDNSIISHHKKMCVDNSNSIPLEGIRKELQEISKHKSVHQEKKLYSEVNIEDMKGIEIELNKKNKLLLNNKRERDPPLVENIGNKNVNNNEEEEIWITKGLIVRIEDKELEKGNYYKLIGKIINTNEYIAEVELFKINKKIKIDQYYLDNIIPSIGFLAYIIKGKHKSKIGIIKQINPDKGIVIIQIKINDNNTLTIPFKNICKYKE